MFGAALYGGYYYGGGAGQAVLTGHIVIANQRQAHVTITAKH